MELVAAVMAMRLAKKVKDSLQIEVPKVRYFTDASAVLGMLNEESGSFMEFVGARVSEVKVKSDPAAEWLWIPGACNPADIGTRQRTQPEDLVLGSEYQCGKDWMCEPEDSWPACRKIEAPPKEEF
jgi:hypothetical protein